MDTQDALTEHLGINGSDEKCSLKSGKRNSRPKAIEKVCKDCQKTLPVADFRHNRRTCHDCEKKYGREYRQSEEGKTKSKTWTENNRERMTELQANWFQDNKAYVRDKNRERTKTDARYKFIVNQRRRISLALGHKQKKTIEYLGCNSDEFFQWMSCQLDGELTLENHGEKWHIDHVIPISNFNLEKEDEVSLALNWRNTMPLPTHENLKKNNKILPEQVKQHLEKLVSYHREKNLVLPQTFIDLFAKHLVDGNPLKQSLPLTSGN
jgi:hypothetical protein